MRLTLSPKEFSLAIDRSESSIKRWVDSSRIKAFKTDGGHRRIAIKEAIRFVRTQRLRLVDPEILGFSDLHYFVEEEWEPGVETDRFYDFLFHGDLEKARGYLLFLYLNGKSVAEICDSPIASAMEKMGKLWEHDPKGIGIEHQATDICLNALTVFKTAFESNPKGLVALGGAPPNDPYVLPSSAVSTVLLSEGFYTINYGPNTPFEVFHQAIQEHNPFLVWLSISHLKRGENLTAEIQRLADYANKKNVYFFVGGREHEKSGIRSISSGSSKVLSVSSMVEFSALLTGLQMK